MSKQASFIKTKEQQQQQSYILLCDQEDIQQNSLPMHYSSDIQAKDILNYLQDKFGKDYEFEIFIEDQKLELNNSIRFKQGNNFKCYYKKKKITKQNIINIKEEVYQKDNDNQQFPNNNNTMIQLNKQEYPQTLIQNQQVNINQHQCQNCDQKFQQLQQFWENKFKALYDKQRFQEKYIFYLSEQLDQHKYFLQQQEQKLRQTDSLIQIRIDMQLSCCLEKIEKEQFEKITQYSIQKDKIILCPNSKCRRKIPFKSIRQLGQLGDQYILMTLSKELTNIYNQYSKKHEPQKFNLIKCQNQNCDFFCFWNDALKLSVKNDSYYCPSCLAYTLKEPKIKFL